ncbi:OmpA family protein [Aequorivita sp. CIP111184]|uniref:OmpA family protein n=1 Tax=Aequorivita sp. CIP111184 TaxID=2211356 RepID=UPI000DBC3CBF|nr:OmpA family protein [Aequorivita sp. CIP111184]SRX54243.1 putative lipoprotein YiaD [Aequorivita sp. CIP111184]
MKTVLILFFICITSLSNAQFLDKLGDRAANAVERTVERRVEKETTKSTDRVLDTIVDAPKTNKKEKKKKKKKTANGNIIGGDPVENNPKSSSSKKTIGSLEEESENQVYFKRGNRIIFNDNFEKDAIGDFPAKWNTTKGGEVKKLKGFDSKFLKVTAGSITNIELTKPLPENFTVEFDLILPADHPYRRPGIGFGPKPEGMNNLIANPNSMTFDIMSAEVGNGYYELSYAEKELGYEKQKIAYKAPLNTAIKMAFEVNGKRIRLFIDRKKMVDLPTQFKPEYRKSLFFTSITSGWTETANAYFYISNLVIAETAGDERSQVMKDLMEKGSFSTNAILFNSGSATIKSGSDLILADIAAALKSTPVLKLKIVGHTDADGGEEANIELSKERANSVRNFLVQNHGIDANRFSTDGKGESSPVADNNSPVGKEQNRRVEFIKL